MNWPLDFETHRFQRRFYDQAMDTTDWDADDAAAKFWRSFNELVRLHYEAVLRDQLDALRAKLPWPLRLVPHRLIYRTSWFDRWLNQWRVMERLSEDGDYEWWIERVPS